MLICVCVCLLIFNNIRLMNIIKCVRFMKTDCIILTIIQKRYIIIDVYSGCFEKRLSVLYDLFYCSRMFLSCPCWRLKTAAYCLILFLYIYHFSFLNRNITQLIYIHKMIFIFTFLLTIRIWRLTNYFYNQTILFN